MAQKRSTRGGWRPGAGRPAEFDDPVDRMFRVERRDAKEAEAVAARLGISVSELIRRALRTYLKKKARQK